MNISVPLFVITILVLGFVISPSVFALNEKKEDKEFKIPPGLSEIAPGVLSLGKAKDVNGNDVDGIMFVHYKKEFAKPQGSGKPSSQNTCYSFLTKGGVKWTGAEPWIVNPVNSAGLNETFILNNIAKNIAKWEDASDGIIGGGKIEIMGDGSSTTATLVPDSLKPDDVNEIYFANISGTGVIAVTTTWYSTFSGQIVEWDQVYDDHDFAWSDSTVNGVAGKMDFENISTHEIGHAVGMGHPSDSCTNETMYRYASLGETIKRTLNTGDIAGIDKLY